MDHVERGTIGLLPYAAIGSGDPVVSLAGLAPVTGVDGDGIVRATIGAFAALAGTHRLVALNRRPGLPRGMTMAQMAAEHADALRDGFDGPVDVIGTSTGGSIAQQLAADHPEVVRRLVLVSTACRLRPEARWFQRRVAARVRAGAHRQALALLAHDLVPPGRGQLPAALAGWLLGPRVLGDPGGLDDMATTIEAEDEFDLAACTQPIGAPTLILGGARDRFYDAALFAETARLIPDSRLRVLPRRGHVTVMRDRRFQAELATFLR
jgi:pimeloyl-ACP methyl ester carboxylesterase